MIEQKICFSNVFNYFSEIYPVSVDAWMDLERFLTLVKLEKDTVLTLENTSPEYIYFVYSGLLRTYFIGNNSREYTKIFNEAFTVASAYPEWLANKPTRYRVVTLEDSLLIRVRFKDFFDLANKHASLKNLAFELTKKYYLLKEKREFELLTMEADERFRVITHELKKTKIKVSKSLIASYLGITPVSFSRLRKNIRL